MPSNVKNVKKITKIQTNRKVFAEKIVPVALKVDEACMINAKSTQPKIQAVFEELLKEAESLRDEITKYSSKSEAMGEFYIIIFIFWLFFN